MNIKADRLEYRRKKIVKINGVLVSIPIHPDLLAVLADLPTTAPISQPLTARAGHRMNLET